MRFLGVIPARYGSTRLEGKPLKDICGHSMIEWVYKRALKADFDKLVVATDDKRVYDEVIQFGGNAIMTSSEHQNGTDRIAEVAETLTDFDVIINIQGDEPLIEADMIKSLKKPFIDDKNLKMATLKYKLTDMEDINNPNIVKVITDNDDYGIYFSRSPIPYPRNLDMDCYYKHIGIYAYKRDYVIEYSKMPSTPLEKAESLEQLRVLENGDKIKVIETDKKIIGVDTAQDLEKVINYIEKNKIKLD